MCDPCVLTEEQIANLPDDDPGEALDLLEKYGIDADGVEDTAEAQRRLRKHLEEQAPGFKCKDCNINRNRINNVINIDAGRAMLKFHGIRASVASIKDVQDLLLEHLEQKQKYEEEQKLSKYSTADVASVVQDMVVQNKEARCKLLEQTSEVKGYLDGIPGKRMDDVRRQMPYLDADLHTVESELQEDNITLMVAGETGSGKSCLLNLLLGALSKQVLSTHILPSTSAMSEIKYGAEPMLKAYPSDPSESVKTIHLDEKTAAQQIQEYTHQKGERKQFQYKKVEIFWPCEWIKNGITITDTPGVGENEELTQMVKDYIPKASGFIYVINTPNAGGINPEELEELLFYHISREGVSEDPDLSLGQVQQSKFDPRSAIFICNKWDQVPTSEREEVKAHVRKKLNKAWKEFDFDHQVFFLSVKKTIDELNTGYVSKEYHRLLVGIQQLLPIGFKAKLEKQFWSLFHIMDRSTWVLKNYIKCDDENDEAKAEREQQYKEAKARLKELQKRPDKVEKEMRNAVDDEAKKAISQIKDYMKSKEVEERLMHWQDSDCPDNDNLDRLQQLQKALAQKRIRQEVSRFEQEEAIFEAMQKRLVDKFQAMFVSIESELAGIEEIMKGDDEIKPKIAPKPKGEAVTFSSKQKVFAGKAKPLLSPISLVIGTLGVPFAGLKAQYKTRQHSKEVKQYRKDKPAAMAKITNEVLTEFMNGDKLNDIIQEKLELLKNRFERLLEKVPDLIKANQLLISQLEKEMQPDEADMTAYIQIYNKGVMMQDEMNYVYMSQVRSYDINLEDIQNMKQVGEGNFGIVYKGKYVNNGKKQRVAVKVLKEPLSQETATDFLIEELNLSRIKSPHVVAYLGTAMEKIDNELYPTMIQEYCPVTFDSIIYNKNRYQGPGSVAESNDKRPALLSKAARFCSEICQGLIAMHNQGFVHRDLKPENILVDTSEGKDTVKLCDLGITKREMDITGTMAGTPMYMAPEIFRERKYNRSVDIFSLGLISWEIWYGMMIDKSYQIDNLKSFRKNAFGKHKPPEDWRDLLTKCWATKPSVRPSANECAQLFDKYQAM